MADKKKPSKKAKIIALAAAGVLAVAGGLVGLSILNTARSLWHENAAGRFAADERFAELSVFLPADANFTLDGVMHTRYEIEKALVARSIPLSEEKRVYVDAFSAFDTVSAASDSGKTTTVRRRKIGGDPAFFYESFAAAPRIGEDINHDRVLLSKTAAWRLYGGYELEDFPVTLGSDTFVVSGVIDDPVSADDKAFYGEDPLIVCDIGRFPDTPVTLYEIILIDPVKGFAKDVLETALPVDKERVLIVENSARFSVPALYKKIPTLLAADEEMPAGVTVTPEEMAARRAEKHLAARFLLMHILLAYPLLVALYLLRKLYKKGKDFLSRTVGSKIRDKLSYS